MNRQVGLVAALGCSLLLLALVYGLAHAGVYRCEVEGRTMYQDQPCTAGIQRVIVAQPEPKALPPAVLATAVPNTGKSTAEAIEEIRAKGRLPAPKIGMTMQEVLGSSWGRPSSMNITTTVRGVREQWVYPQGATQRYLYLENGVVTAIQE